MCQFFETLMLFKVRQNIEHNDVRRTLGDHIGGGEGKNLSSESFRTKGEKAKNIKFFVRHRAGGQTKALNNVK